MQTLLESLRNSEFELLNFHYNIQEAIENKKGRLIVENYIKNDEISRLA